MKPNFMPNLNFNENRLESKANEGKVEAEDLKLAGVNVRVLERPEPKIVVTLPEKKVLTLQMSLTRKL